MIPLPKLQLLATCSLDKTIILWNTLEKKRHKIYREHTRGVMSLAFNESLILLLSAGYDHMICVWNPYISTNQKFSLNV
jgi:WD40 repeat protein